MTQNGETPQAVSAGEKTGTPAVREDNLQYNRQDMDQEQKLDLNPVLQNSQAVHLHINNDVAIYCGKITGTVISKRNHTVVPGAIIRLYFGSDSTLPVYQTSSDQNGNYAIAELPPGYYTLAAEHGTHVKYRSPYVKVLPCQTAHETILMEYSDPKCYLCQKNSI
jgi:hypothetical protein